MAKIEQLQDGATFGEQRNKINQALKSVETDSTIEGDGNTPLSVKAENIKANSTDTSKVLAPDGLGGVEFRDEQGGGGVTDHRLLTQRDANDQHPISAITGLQLALDDKVDSVQAGTNITIDDTDPNNPVISSTGGGGETPPTTDEPVTADLKFDKDYIATTANRLQMTGDVTLSLEGTHTPQVGKVNFFEIQCNGTNAINLSSDFKPSAIQPTDLNGKVLDAKTYQFGTMYFPDGIGINAMQVSGGDAPPVVNVSVVSAVVNDGSASSLVVTFNQAVTISDLTGLSLSFTNGTAKTISSISSGSGSDTLTFALSAPIVAADVFSFDYTDSTTIAAVSGGGVLLAGSTNVTNNVGVPQLATPSLNAPTMGQTTADLTVSASIANNSGYKFEYKESTSGTWIDGGSSAQDVLTRQITGLSTSTQYDFRVTALGDGVNYADSDVSATVQGTTQADTGTIPSPQNLVSLYNYNDVEVDVISGNVTQLNDQIGSNDFATSSDDAARPIIDNNRLYILGKRISELLPQQSVVVDSGVYSVVVGLDLQYVLPSKGNDGLYLYDEITGSNKARIRDNDRVYLNNSPSYNNKVFRKYMSGRHLFFVISDGVNLTLYGEDKVAIHQASSVSQLILGTILCKYTGPYEGNALPSTIPYMYEYAIYDKALDSTDMDTYIDRMNTDYGVNFTNSVSLSSFQLTGISNDDVVTKGTVLDFTIDKSDSRVIDKYMILHLNAGRDINGSPFFIDGSDTSILIDDRFTTQTNTYIELYAIDTNGIVSNKQESVRFTVVDA